MKIEKNAIWTANCGSEYSPRGVLSFYDESNKKKSNFPRGRPVNWTANCGSEYFPRGVLSFYDESNKKKSNFGANCGSEYFPRGVLSLAGLLCQITIKKGNSNLVGLLCETIIKKLQILLDCCVKPCFARLLCRIAFRNQRNRARRANAMPNILRTITSGPASSFHAILRPDSKSGRQKTLRKNSTGSNRHGEPQERKNAYFRPKVLRRVLPRVLQRVLPRVLRRFRRKTKTRQTEPKRAKRV